MLSLTGRCSLKFLPRVEFVQMAFDYKPLNLGQGLPDDLIPQVSN